MTVLLWAILALAVGLAAIAVRSRLAMPSRPPLPPDVELPTTPLQRTSRWTLAVGLVLAAAAAGVVLWFGPETTFDDDQVRLAFTLLLLAVVVVLGGAHMFIKRAADRNSSLMDERDRAILERAPAIQGSGTILTLAVWVIGLTERFHAPGSVPLSHLMLLFWSCLVVNLLALPVGILMGYRRS